MNKAFVFICCMLSASCVTRSYTVEDIAGKYTSQMRLPATNESYRYGLDLMDNRFCDITLGIANIGQGFWYVDNDSVICLFEKASLNDLLSFGRAFEGRMSFAISCNKLENTEFVFNRKRRHTDVNNETIKWNAFTYHPEGQPVDCFGLHSYRIDDLVKMPICYSVYPIKKYTGRTFKLLYSEEDYLVVDAEEINTLPSNKTLYIKKGELAVHTKNFNGERIHLYNKAHKDSDIIYTTEKSHIASIYGIENGWLYVKITEDGEDVYGWLEPEMQCSFPFSDNPCNY